MWGGVFLALVILVTLFFGGGSVMAKTAEFLASVRSPARSAEGTSPYPYFKPETQVLVYSGVGVNGWNSVPFRLIRRVQEYLYGGKFYDIDPNGWVRFNANITSTDANLAEADRVFEPYHSRLPEPQDLVRFVDDQNNHLRHDLSGACQSGDYFWFQGALYFCAEVPENPTEHIVTSTYHVLNAAGQVVPVEEFALARGDSLDAVYEKPVSYTESPINLPALDNGGGFPTDYGFTGHRLDSATGLIYMNSRYYDPQLGRFISPDTIIPERYDSAAFDRYAYARNNPVLYIDPSGHCWGIASGIRGLPTYDVTCNNLDMALSIVQHPQASLGQKAGAAAYIAAEGGAHATLAIGTGMLAWQGGAALIGSGAATTAGSVACADYDCTNEAAAGLNAFSRAAEFGIKTYSDLSNAIKGTGLTAHHIIEQRFATSLGLDPKLMQSVALTPEEHQMFTNFWRNLIGYSNSVQSVTTMNATKEQIWAAAQKVYAQHPELLEAARKTLFGK